MANVGVLGAGSWGTALSVLLSDNGHQVTVWSIDENEVKMLNEKREHELKLPGVKLPDDMVITGDLESDDKRKRFSCACSSFAFYQKYGTERCLLLWRTDRSL